MSKYKSWEEWLEEIGKRESSNNYSAVNKYGYLGRYQMGEGALSDTGYYRGSSSGNTQEWKGSFTGKNNVYSKEDYLNNPQVQDNAMKEYAKKQWQILQGNGSTKYVGSKINGIDITPSGLIAMAHLKGAGYVGQYVKSNGSDIKYDGFGTSPEEYLKKFGGYDVSEIIDPNYYAPMISRNNENTTNRVLNQGAKIISGVANQMFPVKSVPSEVVDNAPIQPPLTREEFLKRIRRQRMGLE